MRINNIRNRGKKLNAHAHNAAGSKRALKDAATRARATCPRYRVSWELTKKLYLEQDFVWKEHKQANISSFYSNTLKIFVSLHFCQKRKVKIEI